MKTSKYLPLIIALIPSLLLAETVPPSTIDELAADASLGSQIAYEVSMPNYGFFIHQKGFLVGLHGKDGKILLDNIGEFILQKQLVDDAGQVTHEHAGWIKDEAVTTEIKETREGMDKAYEVSINAPNLVVKLLIVCKPKGPLLSYEFSARSFPEEGGLSALLPVNFNQTNADAAEVEPDINPVVLYGPNDKRLTIEYSRDFKPYNQSGPAVVTGKTAMSFYPFAGLTSVPDDTKIPLELTVTLGD